MMFYLNNLVKNNESEADGALLLKGTDFEPIQSIFSCLFLLLLIARDC